MGKVTGKKDGGGLADDGESAGASASPGPQSSTRRSVLQMGAGLAAVTGLSRELVAPAIARDPITVPKAPNIIVLMADQERHHRHWPDGWVEKKSALAATAQAPWSLLPPRLYGCMSMLAFARPDADGSFCARESRHPDLSMARPAAQGPAAEHRLAAQGEGRLRGGVEGQMAPELRRQCGDGQWRRRLGLGRYRGDGEELGLVRMEIPPDAGDAIQEWQSTPFGKFDGLRTLGGARPNNDRRYVSGLHPSSPAADHRRGWRKRGGVPEKSCAQARQTVLHVRSRWSIRTISASIRAPG